MTKILDAWHCPLGVDFAQAVGEMGTSRLHAMFAIHVFVKHRYVLNTCSTHCMNMVHFPVFMFHLNGHVNKTWRNRKTFLIWYSVALLLAGEDFQHVSVFHEHVYGEHFMKTACTHFTHSLCKIYTQGTVPCI